jgi:hypothetical protein
MKKLNSVCDNRELKAETLLMQMNLDADLHVQMEGVFPRNYSEDLMKVEQQEDGTTITLSRDGIFHLLPERLFFEENTLKEKGKRFFDFNEEYHELKKKRKELLAFFQPFDATFFKLSLELEQKLNNSDGMLKQVQHDDYITKLKKLLPFASQIRGNLHLLIDLLKHVFSVNKIEIKETEPFKKQFIIHKEGLTKEEYVNMDKELIPFFDFLRHWFLPVEIISDFRIKDFKQPFILGETLILEYNTNL